MVLTVITQTSKLDHLMQHTFKEGARSVDAMRANIHSNSPMVNVLLSGGHGGSLTMCTFRTRSLTAAQSLRRKVWNVSCGEMQAALKGISITSRQAGPYVMVTGLGHFQTGVPACAFVEIYWPTLHCTVLLETFTFSGLISRVSYCESGAESSL